MGIMKSIFHHVKAMWRKIPAVYFYNCYILPHLEYCSPLLLGINKTVGNKPEAANYYELRILLNSPKRHR